MTLVYYKRSSPQHWVTSKPIAQNVFNVWLCAYSPLYETLLRIFTNSPMRDITQPFIFKTGFVIFTRLLIIIVTSQLRVSNELCTLPVFTFNMLKNDRTKPLTSI